MPKRILDVGNCDPDHSSIKELLNQSFDVEVVLVHNQAGAMAELKRSSFDLVLVNRLMDKDGSSGLQIIQAIRSTPALDGTPAMMITNFADHQDKAMEAGAVQGFGKAALSDRSTLELLGEHLQ